MRPCPHPAAHPLGIADSDDARRDPANDRPVWDVPGDDRVRTHDGIPPDGDPRHDDRAITDPATTWQPDGLALGGWLADDRGLGVSEAVMVVRDEHAVGVRHVLLYDHAHLHVDVSEPSQV